MQLRKYLGLTKSLFNPSKATFTSFTQKYDLNDDMLPNFTVNRKTGFLPRKDPLLELPSKYDPVDKILKAAIMHQANGKKGLLWTGDFGAAVKSDLPLIDMSDVKRPDLINALFRDYTFLCSLYILEPCDINWRKSGTYGLGRDRLPKQVAIPLQQLADKLGCRPFMEYALSYDLYNWKRKDPNEGLYLDNLQCYRNVTGGIDENNFIIVHTAMVAHSARVVENTEVAIQAARDNNRELFNKAIADMADTFEIILQVFEQMWYRSKPSEYNNFRTFIMGTYNQPMFPNGVVYEGVDEKPKYFRGESGANDSLIPTLDNLLGLTQEMPINPLTDALREFRSYRPKNHTEWLTWVQDEASSAKVMDYAMQDSLSIYQILRNLDKNRKFRTIHWDLTKAYIITKSKHPVATGGTPIISWLPNNLTTVLNTIHKFGKKSDSKRLSHQEKEIQQLIILRAEEQNETLQAEIENLKKERGHD